MSVKTNSEAEEQNARCVNVTVAVMLKCDTETNSHVVINTQCVMVINMPLSIEEKISKQNIYN